MEKSQVLDNESKIKIPAKIYQDVIYSLFRSNDNDTSFESSSNIETAESVVSKMLHLYEQDSLWIERNKKPLTIALNHVLRMYSDTKATNSEAFDRSLSLVQRFKRLKPNRSNQYPDVSTYNLLLGSLSRSNIKQKDKRTQQIMNEMESNSIEPNMKTYTTAITAMGTDRGNGNMSEEILVKAMKKYDNLSYLEKGNMTFNASSLYAATIVSKVRSGNFDSSKAVQMLDNLEKKYEETRDPNLKPNVALYAAVFDILSRECGRNRSSSALSTALRLLENMETLYEEGHEDMMPDKYCFTSVMVALSRSRLPDAVEKAEKIWERMELLYERTKDESIRPDHVTHSALLFTLLQSKDSENIKRAEELIYKIEDMARNKEMLWPSPAVYTALINAIGRGDSATKGEKIEKIIAHLDEAYLNGILNAKPDTLVFNAAINAWATSITPKKAKKSWKLLNEMCNRYEKGDLGAKPNVSSFTNVLNACAYTKDKRFHLEAVDIAVRIQEKIFSDVDNYGRPDSKFFNMLIRVFGFCIPKDSDRQSFISATFQRCSREGRVDNTVLGSMKKFSPKLYSKLPGFNQGRASLENLPKDWSRNLNRRAMR